MAEVLGLGYLVTGAIVATMIASPNSDSEKTALTTLLAALG